MESLTSSQAILLAIVAVWSLIWKGLALWQAAGNKDKAWYVALLVLNTLGILEMFYLFVFSKRDKKVQ